jgi:hypothetical protein
VSAKNTDWPYDADQHDPLTAQRIPVVGSAWPSWFYIVAFDSGRLDDEHHRPTDREVAMLRSFLDEVLSGLTPWWRSEMAKRPYDIDGGAAGVIFRKWGPDDWGYRRRTWEYGPTYVPAHPRIRARHEGSVGPLDLERVMDRIYTFGDDKPISRWVQWKADHPEVFGTGAGR